MKTLLMAVALVFAASVQAQQKDMTFFITSAGSGKGAAMVGHHDRQGLSDTEAARSWNSSHPSRGCSQDALRSSGGDGLFYCFAVK